MFWGNFYLIGQIKGNFSLFSHTPSGWCITFMLGLVNNYLVSEKKIMTYSTMPSIISLINPKVHTDLKL